VGNIDRRKLLEQFQRGPLIPKDMRIEVVLVHFASSNTTEYEVQLLWTAPNIVIKKDPNTGEETTVEITHKSEVVYLAVADDERTAKKFAERARREMREVVAAWKE